MRLADFIEANRERVVERWQRNVVERLSLELDDSQLRNDLPHFVDDVVEALRDPDGRWPHVEGAEKHGRQRMRVGVNIGTLTEEMTLVGATIAELADEDGEDVSNKNLLRMMNIIGRGASASVGAYAKLRDRELAKQAADHFSFIAHEIRNPLHSARLAAQLVAAAPQAEREKHLKRLDRSLSQLTDLVNDSLIEAQLYGEPQLNIERVAAGELLQEACDDLAEQIAERNLRVETKVADFVLDADRKLLGSAVLNVLRNAVKFSRDGGRIAVEARQADGRALFDFKDQCGGIPADFMPRLFEPFVVARSAKGGSGLGLLIVKQAVEAHGGSVDVDNHPGEGCTFTLNLPCRQEP